MTTAEHVKAITDRALYEQLANAVLRKKYEDLSNLIVGGLNEKGETVKGKLDSFCSVDGNKFHIVEHTTDDSNLERKWLYDKSTYKGKKPKSDTGNGDLIKVIERAKEIKQRIPSAEFTVYLTTNQMVDEALWEKVVACGENNDVSVELLELSAISSFLDLDAHGQYLRKQFLNIDRELLSIEKVFEILKQNLAQYKAESFIDSESLDKEWQLQDLVEHYYREPNLLTLIIADSGMGKSTLCYRLLDELISHPSFGFRVKPEMVLQANNVFHLIELFLKSYDDKLFVNDDFRKFFDEEELVIVVDDVNHCINRSEVLNKLISWSLEIKNDSRIIDFKILCPIWPRYFQQIENLEKKRAGFNYFKLPVPDNEVVESFIINGLSGKVKLTKPELKELCNRTGNDPLLIGFNLERIKKAGSYSINQGTLVLGDFVYDKLALSAERLNYPQFKQKNILTLIGETMLRNKNVDPSYDDLSTWFAHDSQTIALFDALATDRELLFVKEDGGIQFRHDRVRDFILSKGFSKLLFSIHDNDEIISDPFFSNLLAIAIADLKPVQEVLTIIGDKNPVALFYCIKYLQGESDVNYLQQVKDLLSKWVNQNDFPSNNSSMMASITWDLLDTDTSDMQSIISRLPSKRNINMANFKSGDCLSGIRYFANLGDFEPAIGNELRDQILDHVKHYHYNQIVRDLKSILLENELNEDTLKGGFLIAGYLKNSSLPRTLKIAWNTGDKKELCPYYLWSIINCINDETKDVLIDGLDYFINLPDEGHDHGYPKGVRNETEHEFSNVRWKLTDEQVAILDDLYTDYEFIILSIFELLDHPLALKRTIANIAGKIEEARPGSAFSVMYPSDKWAITRCGYRMPDKSLDYLRTYWMDHSNPDIRRRVSYKYWADNALPGDVIKYSKLVEQEDNVLYMSVIRQRMIASDFTVIDQYILNTDTTMLIQYAYHVWTDQLKKQVSFLFQMERNRSELTSMVEILTRLLMKIPVNDAEELLLENWDMINRNVYGVQVALYIQTECALKLVDKAIHEIDDPNSLFKHINSTFGFWNPTMQGRISNTFLKRLNPYLKYFSDYSLNSIAQICYRLGYKDWVLNDLLPFLKSEQQSYYLPNTQDLLAEMREEKYTKSHSARSWISTLNQRNLSIERITPALEIYAKEITTLHEFNFLADCLDGMGKRTHLHLFDVFVPSDEIRMVFSEIKESVTHMVKERSLN
ncbi:hypothetical protein SAMN05421820_101483 [Pedobacter steynii]|uniref:Uncharacterized protein n=1 Tax=Pedobacter steynii TaxID=430522 RepID=A0A1G9K684_9SPHI|nr:hypothetical protein [Pedobacter steynii]NQX38462.1 hypothetical protein [Pedobacter steynii]SDL45281.1 hypothetical protein SAMN05421820_101483 [Pedobacter steynii]